jgi:hypothetical protein
MNDWLAIKLNQKLKIVEIYGAKTSGLAHQKANEFTDAGFHARVVPPEDADEVTYLYDQMCQKQELGFIEEYGHVPNGTRSNGDGARTVGNMIFPAFGGIVERESTQPSLSSVEFHSKPKKLQLFLRNNG